MQKPGTCVLSPFSRVRLFATMWTVVHQAPLSLEFSRLDYRSGLPFPSAGNVPNPGIEPCLLYCRRTLYCWATRSPNTWRPHLFGPHFFSPKKTEWPQSQRRGKASHTMTARKSSLPSSAGPSVRKKGLSRAATPFLTFFSPFGKMT